MTGKRKANRIKVFSNRAMIYMPTDEACLVSLEDLERLKPYYWSYPKNGKRPENRYVKSYTGTENGLYIHRLIAGSVPTGRFVDHINRNSLDNRRSNLRIVTAQQNAQNRLRKDGDGVYFRANCPLNPWQVTIRTPVGKLMIIGQFPTRELALTAKREARQKHFGRFAPKEK